MGLRGRPGRLGRRARALGDHLHRLRPCRTGRLSRYDGGLHTVERHGIVRHPEDKNAALLPHRIDGRWVLLHRPRPSSAARTARSFSPARTTSSTGALPSRCSNRVPAPGGTRCGSASARRRSAPSTAGCSSTTASRTPWPATCIASGSRCSTSTSRPASSAAYRTGSSPARGLRANRRRSQRRLSLRPSPRLVERRDPPLLRRRRQLHLSRHRTTARPHRSGPRRAARDLADREGRSPTALVPIPAVEPGELRTRVEAELISVDVDPSVGLSGGASFGAHERRDDGDRRFG